MSERERRELEGSGSYQRDAVPVDLQTQRRELEEAGWKQNLYPQGVAIRMVREAAENESEEEY